LKWSGSSSYPAPLLLIILVSDPYCIANPMIHTTSTCSVAALCARILTYRVFVASCSTNLPSLAVATPSKYSRISCGSMKFVGLRFSRLRSNAAKRPREGLCGCARFAVQPKQYQASFNSGAFWLKGGSRQWRWNELSQPSQQRRNPLVLQAVQKSLLSD
jgi:hypothetical protein